MSTGIVLGPDGLALRNGHFVIGVPDFSDLATLTATLAPQSGTVLADLVTRQPSDVVEFDVSGSAVALRFTNTARAPFDVMWAIANATPDAVWQIDAGDGDADLAGTGATDATAQGHDGTVVNGATFAPGRYGHALACDNPTNNDGQGLVTPGHAAFTGNVCTVMAWIYPRRFGPVSQTIFYQDNGATERSILLAITGRITVATHAGGVTSPDPVIADTWTHVAVTYDGTTVRLYLDGVDVGSAVEPFGGGAADLEWAQNSNLNGLDGLLDDVRYYARALDLTEIAAARDAEAAAPYDADLEVYYRFNAYRSGVRTFGMSPNAVRHAFEDPRRAGFLLMPYRMTTAIVRVTIDDPTNPLPLRIGRVVVGTAWQPSRNYDYPPRLIAEDDASITRTPANQTLVTAARPLLEGLEFVVRMLPREEILANAYHLRRILGSFRECVVCLDPEDDAYQEMLTCYGRLTSVSTIEMPHHNLWQTDYRVEALL